MDDENRLHLKSGQATTAPLLSVERVGMLSLHCVHFAMPFQRTRRGKVFRHRNPDSMQLTQITRPALFFQQYIEKYSLSAEADDQLKMKKLELR